MPLEPFFEIGEIEIPGDYRAFFVPSQPGDYTFHITGTIDGTKVDESFTFGPEDVRVGARRLERDVPAGPGSDERGPRNPHPDRVRSDVDGAHRRDDRGDERSGGRHSAKDAADSAKTVGIIAVIVGVIALIVGVVALSASRKKA